MGVLASDKASALASPLVAVEEVSRCGASAVLAGDAREEVPGSPEEGEPRDAQACVEAQPAQEPLVLDDVLHALQPLLKYRECLQVCPWRDFAKFSNPRSFTEACCRARSNLPAYRANYACVGVVCSCAALVMCPPALLVFLMLSLVWSALVKHADSPEWKVKVGLWELGKYEQKAAFGVVSVAAFVFFIVPLLLWAVPSCLTLVLLHAVSHPAIGATQMCEPLEERQAREVVIDPEAPLFAAMAK